MRRASWRVLLAPLGALGRAIRPLAYITPMWHGVDLCRGLALGTIYGWAGSLTALASDHHVGGYFWLSFPVWLPAGVFIAAGILAIIASLAPAARAMRVPPAMAASVD